MEAMSLARGMQSSCSLQHWDMIKSAGKGGGKGAEELQHGVAYFQEQPCEDQILKMVLPLK